jgi:hypothetical protein
MTPRNPLCDFDCSDHPALAEERPIDADAARDLLAACKQIADMAVHGEPLSIGDIQDVLRAIAKAEGPS